MLWLKLKHVSNREPWSFDQFHHDGRITWTRFTFHWDYIGYWWFLITKCYTWGVDDALRHHDVRVTSLQCKLTMVSHDIANLSHTKCLFFKNNKPALLPAAAWPIRGLSLHVATALGWLFIIYLVNTPNCATRNKNNTICIPSMQVHIFFCIMFNLRLELILSCLNYFILHFCLEHQAIFIIVYLFDGFAVEYFAIPLPLKAYICRKNNSYLVNELSNSKIGHRRRSIIPVTLTFATRVN